MVSNDEDLTSTCNRFHDHSETISFLLALQRLDGEANQEGLVGSGGCDGSNDSGAALGRCQGRRRLSLDRRAPGPEHASVLPIALLRG